jgi:hypothetical protein
VKLSDGENLSEYLLKILITKNFAPYFNSALPNWGIVLEVDQDN